MRYLALCCDYDGTIAHLGQVDDSTIAALERVVESGRRLLLVTGRELGDLQRVFARLDLFDCVVAENGALLYRPATREEKPLAPPPSPALVQALRARHVVPLSLGRCIVATWTPHETAVIVAIRELGLELQVIFNKGAVMVLPSGVNKASGLAAALDALGLSPHNAVGIGDAENDHAFLAFAECAVAVANALPALKEKADFVTSGDHGAGVVELIDALIADDLAQLEPRLQRHHIPLAGDGAGDELRVPPCGSNLLVVGTSGSGKSTVATALLERLIERGWSYCVIDPEGDYQSLPDAVSLGTPERAPSLDEAVQLAQQRGNAVINLVGLPLADRPAFFAALLPRLQALVAQRGRPHWLVIDEAHHLLPAAQPEAPRLHGLGSVLQISVHPDLIARQALAGVDTVIAVGNDPASRLREFAAARGERIDGSDGIGGSGGSGDSGGGRSNGGSSSGSGSEIELDAGEALVWRLGERWRRLRLIPSRTERRRHLRKYAEGELPPDRSFWFRGPKNELKLRAQNLIVFLQMADGVDDDTWRYHLERGDYSRWFAEGIKDDALAGEARRIEAMRGVSPHDSRALMREAVERVYTLPTG